jgi:hypothetical protein
MKRGLILIAMSAGLAGCVQSTATRTSANSVMIDTGAAPICGSGGAARVSAKMAAVETLRNGYERYMITGAQSANNVQSTQMGGTFQASAGVVTYTPGPTIISGSHDRTLMVHMFRAGEPGYANGIDAKQQLGPEWATLVREGIKSCF